VPIPLASQSDVQRITEFVGQYFRAVASDDAAKPAVAPEVARDLLLRVDAEVLRLYDLPPRIERQLLDLFAGWPRLGMPFSFDRYFPDGFTPCFPLHEYLSSSYAASTAGHLRTQTNPKVPSEFLLALDEATSVFEE
jgi:hypothetical protein